MSRKQCQLVKSAYDGDTLFVRGEMKSCRDERFENTWAESFVESAQSLVGDDLARAVHKAMIVTR